MKGTNMTEAQAKKLGYSITRGSYQGTTDDRLDRWYIEREGDPVCRIGGGFLTKKAALEHLSVMLND
jgi:hypothetical protein